MRMRFVIRYSSDLPYDFMAGSRGAKTETGVSITDLGDLDFTSTGKKLTPYKIDPDTAWRSHLLLSTFSMLLPSMGMAAPPTAWPRAWLSRLSGRRARANRVGVRRWAAVAPQVIATLEIGGLAQEVAPEEL